MIVELKGFRMAIMAHVIRCDSKNVSRCVDVQTKVLVKEPFAYAYTDSE